MRKVIAFLALFVVVGVSRAQEPIPVVHRNLVSRTAIGIGHEMKGTVTDIKRHPYAWGLNLGIQIGAMFADTATSCMLPSPEYAEVGTARFFVGRYPNCRKFVALNIGQILVGMPAEHWLAHKFDDSCHAQAASHDPRWDNTPAHTHDPNCFWAVPVGFSIASFATSYGPIKGNVNLLESRQ